MYKDCVICGKTFSTKDSRQKTCSKECADVSRARYRPEKLEVPPKPQTYKTKEDTLPPVEDLPATYLKRCYDLWSQLVDGETPDKRIA